MGDLTAQGVLQDVAIAEIEALLGSPEDGDNPATGLYGAIAGIELDTTEVEGKLDTLAEAIPANLSATITALETNLGMPAYTDEGGDLVPATGIYAKVDAAIKAGTDAEQAVTNILGDYVDFAAFEVALTEAIGQKIDGIALDFGSAPVFQTDNEGNVLRDETTGERLFEEGGEPTGIQGDIYNAMLLEGVDRDLALAVLEGKINEKITELQEFTTNTTAETIKQDILDVYFPAKPDDFDVGRDISDELGYVQQLIATGQLDMAYDKNSDGQISQDDYNAIINSLDATQVTALENYNTWASNSTAITPALETLSIETGANFGILDRRIDSVESSVTEYIAENVTDVIGKPAEGDDPATGLFLAIEEGDDDVLSKLGTASTIDGTTGLSNNDGTGIIRDLELLGYDNQQIKNYLDTNLGKPAEGDDAATGLFAAVAENQTTLDNIETWFTTYVDSVIAATDGAAREGDLLTASDISTAVDNVIGDLALADSVLTAAQVESAISTQLTSIAQGTDLLTASDISTAVDNVIADLATSDAILTDEQIQKAISDQLTSIAQGTDLLTASDISTAVDNVIGDLALSGSVLTSLQIQEAITSQLTKYSYEHRPTYC